MREQLDRDKIRASLARELDNLQADFDCVIADMNALGSTAAVAGQEEARAQDYKALEFKGAMVQQQLTAYKKLILHADYCDHYITINEGCHKSTSARIDKIAEAIKPFTEIKRDFMGIGNVGSMGKKAVAKFIEWGAIFAIFKYLIDAAKAVT